MYKSTFFAKSESKKDVDTNFAKLIRNTPSHYYDKSLFIDYDLTDKRKIKVFSLPSGSGKSLNLSMLRHFYSATVDGKETQSLFKNLKISNFPEHMKEQGKYTVIHVDFSNFNVNNYEELYKQLCNTMKELYAEHAYVLQSEYLRNPDKKRFNFVLELNPENCYDNENIYALKKSLENLVSCVFHSCDSSNGKRNKIIILIDGYNKLIPPLHENDEKITSFAEQFYFFLKDSNEFYRAVITGTSKDFYPLPMAFGFCTHVETVSDCFKELQHLTEDSFALVSTSFRQYFGLTELEVNDLLKKNNLTNNANELQSNYSYLFNYRFTYRQARELPVHLQNKLEWNPSLGSPKQILKILPRSIALDLYDYVYPEEMLKMFNPSEVFTYIDKKLIAKQCQSTTVSPGI